MDLEIEQEINELDVAMSVYPDIMIEAFVTMIREGSARVSDTYRPLLQANLEFRERNPDTPPLWHMLRENLYR